MVSHQVLNSPRLIYYISKMTSRLSGNISEFGLVLIVLKSLLETARQCSREKFAILSLKPRRHVTILIHRTWAFLRNWFTWHKIKYFIDFWIHSSNSKRKRKEKKAEIIAVGWRYAPCREPSEESKLNSFFCVLYCLSNCIMAHLGKATWVDVRIFATIFFVSFALYYSLLDPSR